MKRVSLADLSEQLHLSKTLISLVLNNKGDRHGISKATQARVLAKAAELNYYPNPMARGLRMGCSGTIGLIVADIANPFYASIARHIEDEAARLGYNLIICSSDENDEKEIRLLTMLRDRQVDGLIVSSTLRKAHPLLAIRKLNYPIVMIDRNIPKLDIPSVLVDNFQGAYDLTKHLIETGHTRIAHLSISPNYLSTIRDRLRGYREAMKEAGIRVQSAWLLDIPFDSVTDSVKAMLPPLFRQPTGVTAIFTANNNLAVAALGTIRKYNLRIPDDIAIASFDDIDLFRLYNPPVTAISQPNKEIAREAVILIKDMIDKRSPQNDATTIMLKTTLHIRPSTVNPAHAKT